MLVALKILLSNHRHFVRAMSSTASSKPLIVFCHGSGDTGEGARAWIEHLVPASEYQKWDWIFPTAEPIPYQLNGGMVSSVWYDRNGGFDPSFPEHTESVERSASRLISLIRSECSSSGRDPGRVIIGGFSMGGAIAYQTAARWHAQPDAVSLGGVFGLSCYLNQDSKVWSILQKQQKQSWPPTFIAHGGSDDFILAKWGQATYERMEEMGIPADFRIVPGVHHDMVKGEIQELLQFLRTNLEKKNAAKEQSATASSNEL